MLALVASIPALRPYSAVSGARYPPPVKEQAGVQGAFTHQYERPQQIQQYHQQPHGQQPYSQQPYTQPPAYTRPDASAMDVGGPSDELSHLQAVYEQSQATLAEEYAAMVADVQARQAPVSTARPRGRVVPTSPRQQARPMGSIAYQVPVGADAVQGGPSCTPQSEPYRAQGGSHSWGVRSAVERTQLRGQADLARPAVTGSAVPDVPIVPWSPSAGITTKPSSAVAAEGCNDVQGGSPTWRVRSAAERRGLRDVGGPSDELIHLQAVYEQSQAMLAEEYAAMVADVQARQGQ